jgi:serine palmitoyltransferase
MMGEDGTEIGIEKNQRLIQNIRYFRQKLKDMNFIIYGHEDTAIISVLSFYMPKTILFGREALKRGLAICCVGYPAVPLNKSRVRFCINSEHTKSQMDKVRIYCF